MCEKPETDGLIVVPCDASAQSAIRRRLRLATLSRIAAALTLGAVAVFLWSGSRNSGTPATGAAVAVLVGGLVAAASGLASVVLCHRYGGGSYVGMIVGLIVLGIGALHLFIGIPQKRFYRQFGSTEGLREVHNAAEQYQRRHQALPPDLPTLVAERMASGEPQVPWLGRKRCDPPTGRTYDFLYVPPAAGAPPTTVVACDFRGNQEDDARFVLYADGRVSGLLSPAAFAAELARPENAAFAAALRAAEGP